MKKLIAVIGIALLAVSSQSQTTNSIPSFISQVETWALNVNTNYDWLNTNITIQVESGYKQVTGSGAASYVGVQYDIGRWNIGIQGQFFGVGSSFNAVEVGGGYAFYVNHDFKIDANLFGGYQKDLKAYIVEPQIRASKMMTANTYVDSAISMPFQSKGKFNSSPTFTVGVGFFF